MAPRPAAPTGSFLAARPGIAVRIAVLGATGRTGRLFVERALDAGHEVAALARDPGTLGLSHPRLRVVAGDVTDGEKVRALVSEADAVVSALGPTKRGPADVCSAATANVLAAMEGAPRRYVVVSGAGLDVSGDEKDLAGRMISRLVRFASPAMVADKERELRLLEESSAEWVLVRPPRLTDAPGSGTYRVSTTRAPGPKLSRADLADFLLKQLEDRSFVRRSPFIAA